MKRLFLLRHAKASPDETALGDSGRPLTPSGEVAAEMMGREMRALGLDFGAVVASPARRVVETLAHVAQGYGRDLAPQFDRRLYAARADGLLSIVRDSVDAVGTLLVVGHNPGLHRLALTLSAADNSTALKILSAKFPTGSLAELVFSTEHWGEIAAGRGRLERFLRPRDLRSD